MKIKNKKGNNKKIDPWIIFIIILLIFIILYLIIYLFIDIDLIGNKNITLNYGETYKEPGYRAKFINKNITKDLKIYNNINHDIGNYEVNYVYSFGIIRKQVKRNIYVKDITGPKIELKLDDNYSVTIGNKYEEPGYKAIDNLDGDITSNVTITNKVDVNKLGTYDVIYECTDKNNNKTTKIRKVKVTKKSPLQLSLIDYNLDGFYEDTKLQPTKDYGDEYFNKITVIGDSNIKNFYINGLIDGKRAWALPCLHAQSMHELKLYLYGYRSRMVLLDAIEKYKPEIILLNFGTFSSGWIGKNEFMHYSRLMIENIQKKSPNTKIILCSIFPIRKGLNPNEFSQKTINDYNFYILEMAHEYNLKYLDVQEVLKSADGYGDKNYYVPDNLHLNKLGHSVLKKYIKTHAWEV